MFLKNSFFSADKNSAQAQTKKDGGLSIVTKEMHILGNIVTEGILDFDGTLEGNMRCHTLTVRQNGNIKGEITADTVIVYGKVNGIIRARSVHLQSTCHVEGIVMHETIAMEDGAFLDGKCKRSDKAVPAEDNSDDFEDVMSGATKMLENIRLIRS